MIGARRLFGFLLFGVFKILCDYLLITISIDIDKLCTCVSHIVRPNNREFLAELQYMRRVATLCVTGPSGHIGPNYKHEVRNAIAIYVFQRHCNKIFR